MTPEQALNIFEQLRLQTNASGELHDQVREALEVLRVAVGLTKPVGKS